MSSTTNENPRGLFKRETKGHLIRPVTVEIERGRIRFFSETLGFTDPIYFDVEAARAAGHPDLVAPPTYAMVIDALASEAREKRGETGAAELVGCDFRYLLHGDEHYTYHGLIFAGEDVSIETEVLDFYDKKGGAMEFVQFETRIAHAERGLLVTARRTLLHRLG